MHTQNQKMSILHYTNSTFVCKHFLKHLALFCVQAVKFKIVVGKSVVCKWFGIVIVTETGESRKFNRFGREGVA